MLIGMMLNATVTIANRGFMPTKNPSLESHSIWAAVAPGHNLVFLGDNYIGCSIGDIVSAIGLGIVLVFSFHWLYRDFKRYRREKEQADANRTT